MFDEIAGLPAHPLLIHAALVLTPALALVAIGHTVLPMARARLERPLALLAVVAPLSVAIARESGAALQRRLARDETVAPDLLDQVEAHAASARTLLLLTLALGAVCLGWIVLKPRLESAAVVAVLGAVTGSLGVAVLWSVVHTGHSGTVMVWG